MTAARRISLVIADDHPIVLEGVARVLEAEADFDLRARCESGSGAWRAILDQRPDVAVLDIAMPEMSGLDVMARITAQGLPTGVIFLTANATETNVLAAIERGARGIILKDAAITDLPACVRAIAAGGRHFPQEMVDQAVERATGRRLEQDFAHNLSAREREVLLLAAEGLPNKQIARQLGLTEGTVKIHMHNIYQKTGIGSRTALTALALAHRKRLRT